MKYFAYGSNMDPDRMIERGVSFSQREHAVLRGWRLTFNKISLKKTNEGYANIEKDDKSVVEGILYEIQDEDIEKLDGYEGVPSHYKRLNIVVHSKSGATEAITYVANPEKVKQGLKPSKDYLNHLLKGCDLLSEEYCEKLNKWKTVD